MLVLLLLLLYKLCFRSVLGASTCWRDLRLGIPTTSSSGNCKAEDQISGGKARPATRLLPLPASPSLCTSHKLSPKAKPVPSFHWFHEHSTLSPRCWEGRAILHQAPQPRWTHRTAEACRWLLAVSLVHNVMVAMVILCLCFYSIQDLASLT